MIKDVTDLNVYKQSLELLPKLYELLRKLPSSEKDLEFQAKRAAKSVPANIAEGFAKRFSEKEFKRFLMIAIGSSDEVISHLRAVALVVPRLELASSELLDSYKILSKRLNTLHKFWRFGGPHNNSNF